MRSQTLLLSLAVAALTLTIAAITLAEHTDGPASGSTETFKDPETTDDDLLAGFETTTTEVCTSSNWSVTCRCADDGSWCGWARNVSCDGVDVGVDVFDVPRDECLMGWTWSEWSAWTPCNATCEEDGVRQRWRKCMTSSSPPEVEPLSCTGQANESDRCSATCRPTEAWSEWLAWSACSVTCGAGFSARSRECESAAIPASASETVNQTNATGCAGSPSQRQVCQMAACVAAVAEWSQWSPCGVTCGGGVRSRYRRCGDASAGNDSCGDQQTEEIQVCGNVSCAIDADEINNGVFVNLETDMTTDQYAKIKGILLNALVIVINGFCNDDVNFPSCCPGYIARSTQRQLAYVDNTTVELGGADKPSAHALRFFMLIHPALNNSLCADGMEPAAATVATTEVTTAATGRRRRALSAAGATALYLPLQVITAVANSSAFSLAIVSTVSQNLPGVVVVVKGVASASSVLLTSTAASTSSSSSSFAEVSVQLHTSVEPAAASQAQSSPSDAALVVGVSVGGSLALLGLIVIIAVLVRKWQLRTGKVTVSEGPPTERLEGGNSAVGSYSPRGDPFAVEAP